VSLELIKREEALMRAFLLLIIIGPASAGSTFGHHKTNSIDNAREGRIRSEVGGVKAALLAKLGAEGEDHEDHGSAPSSPPLATSIMNATTTASPVATLNTHGITIIDPKETHSPSKSTIDLVIESSTLLIEIGGLALDISAVEVKMDNILEDRLTAYVQKEIGGMVESVSVNLNFLEDSAHQNGEGETTGDVEIDVKIHLKTNDTSLLEGLDDAYATHILESFFVGDSLEDLLDALNITGTTLSFIRLRAKSVDPTVPLASAFGGVLAFVVCAGIMIRRSRTRKTVTDSLEIDADESEEDQFHPLARIPVPVQPLSTFRSTSNPFDDVFSDEDEDSLGSDRYLNWPIEREVRTRWKKSSLHDVSVDSDDESIDRII
jgi:hypothetical protein